MTTTDRTILVTGATGQQGGATARHLLADGWHVRALVRDPRGAAATLLARAGADLITGDMDDRGSIDAAVRGAHGVFSVQPAFIAPDYAENELQRGLNVVDAAMAAGVRHLVYASVASADRATGIPHWEIKWKIEEYIRAHGVPATVLRPVTFMENFADPTYGVRGEASLIRAFPADSTVQLIALDDIGAFAALAFASPDPFRGRVLELAGDELTPHQIASAIGRATGHDVAVPVPARGGPGGTTSFCDWQADIPALRTIHPGLLDFGTWLSREGKALLEKHYQHVGHR
ncbi:NmrA/HSCARG family protein [Sphaerisporangium rhizosphaerae]|uniref:NmrA/HSCARG family protein n=1 Tax=Sphaerisporangium rhizosphaerae TaxID=2269375 RepID=A0ABW2P174_9ACTN